MGGPTYRKLGYDCRHDLQDLSITSVWHVSVVVNQHRIKEGWHDVRSNHLQIIRLLDICLDEL